MAHCQVHEKSGANVSKLGQEIDLLRNYPRTKRNLEERASGKTEDVRAIARRFDQEFFDGDRKYGYGGFSYDPRFWQPVVPDFSSHFGGLENKKILDVGCGKGFMLFDLLELVPGIKVAGLDISTYAIENALPEVKPRLTVGNAKSLPYADDEFDVVISINTIHNLEIEECKLALREISRVSRGASFITVDAYRTQEEMERMFAWNLTAKTILSVDEWKEVFHEVGYEGDFFWFLP